MINSLKPDSRYLTKPELMQSKALCIQYGHQIINYITKHRRNGTDYFTGWQFSTDEITNAEGEQIAQRVRDINDLKKSK